MDKYYFPKIEEIHVGYKCETTSNGKDWYPWQFGFWDFGALDLEILNSMYRTPYLTQEQIEAEGWGYKGIINGGSPDTEQLFFQKNEGVVFYQLFLGRGDRQIAISGWYHNNIYHPSTKTLYQGKCPSINELRIIQKFLKIKE